MIATGMIPCVGAFFLVLVATPIVIGACRRWRLLDSPGELTIHAQPIPRLGGIAIVLALSLTTVLAPRHSSALPWRFFAALLLIWSVGLMDDLRRLSPLLRLAAQAAAGGILWSPGWRLPLFGNGIPGFAAQCIFVILFINAFNFLDGSDGLAAGVAAIIAISYIALPHAGHSMIGAALAWSLLGSCAGFLVFNFPPAKIFMGDSGSTALGLSVAFLSLDFYHSNPGAKFGPIFPILVGLLPLIDLIFAVIRRVRAHVSPFQGDRGHFYDLLLARGWSVRRVALASYAATAVLALIGRLEL